MEKLRAIREQQNRKQREAREAFNIMKEKADSFPIPIHLAGCHTLTKCMIYYQFQVVRPHSLAYSKKLAVFSSLYI